MRVAAHQAEGHGVEEQGAQHELAAHAHQRRALEGAAVEGVGRVAEARYRQGGQRHGAHVPAPIDAPQGHVERRGQALVVPTAPRAGRVALHPGVAHVLLVHELLQHRRVDRPPQRERGAVAAPRQRHAPAPVQVQHRVARPGQAHRDVEVGAHQAQAILPAQPRIAPRQRQLGREALLGPDAVGEAPPAVVGRRGPHLGGALVLGPPGAGGVGHEVDALRVVRAPVERQAVAHRERPAVGGAGHGQRGPHGAPPQPARPGVQAVVVPGGLAGLGEPRVGEQGGPGARPGVRGHHSRACVGQGHVGRRGPAVPSRGVAARQLEAQVAEARRIEVPGGNPGRGQHAGPGAVGARVPRGRGVVTGEGAGRRGVAWARVLPLGAGRR